MIIADCVLLNLTKHREFYEELKIHDYEKETFRFSI